MSKFRHILSLLRNKSDNRFISQVIKRYLLVSLFALFIFISTQAQITLVNFNFDNDSLTGWTYDAWGLNGDDNNQCSWKIGKPRGGYGYNDIWGQRGFIGNPDPTNDFTTDNTINFVAGQGLKKSSKKEGASGHFNNSSEWFQSPALNFADYYNVTLEYYRWANFEIGYDLAFIEISNDGTNWNIVYNPSTLQDNGWVKHTIDISKYADRQSLVYIRWRSESDGSVFYAGWNIDDITITGKNSTNDNTSSITAGNIIVPTTISSISDSYNERVTFGNFTITDAGSGDALPTIIDTLIIKAGANNTVDQWETSINSIYIYEPASGKERIGTIQDGRIIFPNNNLFTIPDGSSKTYELSFYLDVNILGAKDNAQFEFIIDYGDVIVDPSGSFIGSGELSTGASKLIVDIQATQLSFLVEPEQLVNVNRDLLPYMQVAATDENGNIDVDYIGTINLSNSGGLSMIGNSQTARAGIATFTACQFTQTGGPVMILNSHSGSSSIINTSTNVSVTVQDNLSDAIYYSNFDNTGLTGWTSGAKYGSNSWKTGSPNGGRGYSSIFTSRGWVGNADPKVDHSTDNSLNKVYGQGLGSSSKTQGVSGYYHSSEEWLMTPAIDLSNYYNSQLSFWRWANLEPYYDSAFVEISLDGNNWIDLGHPLFPSDKKWTQVIYDISSIADRQTSVYIRWRIISDESVYYSGWNIDDVVISGIFSPVTNWTGTSSSDWNNAANWSTGIVPTRLSNVYINTTSPYHPIVISAAECNEIIIKKNAILEIDYSGNLTVFGDVQIETDSKNYGAVIDRGRLTIYGKGKVSRYLLSNQWHYISSPIENVNSSLFGNKIYFYNEVLASENWFKGWEMAENISLVNVRGYDVKNDKNEIINLEGKFNTGNFGINITNTDGIEVSEHEGWNLVGNPYPSAIDWDASTGWTKTNVNDAIYIWDESKQNFVTYISGVGANGGSRYIPPMQGFFVRVVNPGNGYIGMTNDVRIANTTAKFKSSKSNVEGLKIRISNSTYSDETILRFIDGAGMNFDYALDAYKKFSENNTVPQIFTKTGKGEQLSINSYPANNEYSVVPVYISVSSPGEYNLQFEGAGNIDYSQTVYLEDLENDTLIDLLANSTYSFYSEKLKGTKRFLLHIGMPLRIEYTVKNVSEIGASNGEIDLTIYGGKQPLTKVEWSNGIKTEDLTKLTTGIYIVSISDAANNVLIDTITIKQASEALYNNDISSDKEGNSELKVFANNNTLHIIPSDTQKPIEIVEVYDLTGKLIYSSKEQLFGITSIQLNNIKGLYLARISYQGISSTKKFILK